MKRKGNFNALIAKIKKIKATRLDLHLGTEQVLISNSGIREEEFKGEWNGNFLSFDMSFEVLRFIDSIQLLTNCLLVCRQWYDVIMKRIKFDFQIGELGDWKKLSQSHQKYNDRVERLQLVGGLLMFRVNEKQFNNLLELDLRDQKLGTKGAECLRYLKQLTVLDVSNTDISACDGVKYISKIENLTKLNISSVALDLDLGYLTYLKKLTSLDVHYCNLNFIEHAEIIGGLKSLTFLDIGNNELGPLGLLAISPLVSLQTLYAERIGIEGESCESLSKLTNLTELYISENDFGLEGLKSIGAMKTLKVLDIGNKNITDALGDDASKLISSLTQLTYLNISKHEITSCGAKYLTCLTKLRTLEIDGNEICDDFLDSISSLKELTHLNISGGDISVKGIKSISKLARLTVLDISECVSFGKEVLKQLGLLKQLMSLHLSMTNLTDITEGFKYWYKNLTNLTYLEMNFCDLDDNAIKFVSGIPNLRYLDLESNNLTDNCINHLLEMKKLKFISLAGNYITEKKIKRLKKYLNKDHESS